MHTCAWASFRMIMRAAERVCRSRAQWKAPARMNPGTGRLRILSTVCGGFPGGEYRRDRRRGVRERDEHLDGSASVVDADPAEVSPSGAADPALHDTFERHD